MNMVSSRSHAIFSVILKQTKVENLEENKENDVPPPSKRKSKQKSLTSKITSKFYFVDLAGSERVTNVLHFISSFLNSIICLIIYH